MKHTFAFWGQNEVKDFKLKTCDCTDPRCTGKFLQTKKGQKKCLFSEYD